MALPIPAREIAVGDYIPGEGYGTVKQVRKPKTGYTEITFVNGQVIMPDNDREILVEQGGRF